MQRFGRYLLVAVFLGCFPAFQEVQTWRGLRVDKELRCTPYKKKDYRSRASLEERIVEAMGGRIYGPYTGRTFKSTKEAEVEHIVALEEAHDSGLCHRSLGSRKAFGEDLMNLTLAARDMDRSKGSKDAGEWLPEKNRCWFAQKVVAVKTKYRLTVDWRERDELEGILSRCDSFELKWVATEDGVSQPEPEK